ncbi:hypothetical protein J437_LFUL018267, partial [Ladona fulva]
MKVTPLCSSSGGRRISRVSAQWSRSKLTRLSKWEVKFPFMVCVNQLLSGQKVNLYCICWLGF